ncbi:MAG TPA: hypothetical protein VGX49_07290 [Jatrophihabitans sp.]|jgi:hypothetical protein|nr:hypothetical protein [Jatrophihabitans sp.]
MVRKLLVLLATLAATLGLMVPTATTSSALGGEWLACGMTGGPNYYASPCVGGSSSGPVVINFAVLYETGSSTYSWAVPAVYVPNINEGCTSNSNYCQLIVGRGSKQILMSVTLTQGQATETLSTNAYVEPYCGDTWC